MDNLRPIGTHYYTALPTNIIKLNSQPRLADQVTNQQIGTLVGAETIGECPSCTLILPSTPATANRMLTVDSLAIKGRLRKGRSRQLINVSLLTPSGSFIVALDNGGSIRIDCIDVYSSWSRLGTILAPSRCINNRLTLGCELQWAPSYDAAGGGGKAAFPVHEHHATSLEGATRQQRRVTRVS